MRTSSSALAAFGLSACFVTIEPLRERDVEPDAMATPDAGPPVVDTATADAADAAHTLSQDAALPDTSPPDAAPETATEDAGGTPSLAPWTCLADATQDGFVDFQDFGKVDLDFDGDIDEADDQLVTAALGPLSCDGALPGAEWRCIGDIDQSGAVDSTDLGLLLACNNSAAPQCATADLNYDQKVTDIDLQVLQVIWNTGVTCPAVD